jgi:hypothetical protein
MNNETEILQRLRFFERKNEVKKSIEFLKTKKGIYQESSLVRDLLSEWWSDSLRGTHIPYFDDKCYGPEGIQSLETWVLLFRIHEIITTDMYQSENDVKPTSIELRPRQTIVKVSAKDVDDSTITFIMKHTPENRGLAISHRCTYKDTETHTWNEDACTWHLNLHAKKYVDMWDSEEGTKDAHQIFLRTFFNVMQISPSFQSAIWRQTYSFDAEDLGHEMYDALYLS